MCRTIHLLLKSNKKERKIKIMEDEKIIFKVSVSKKELSKLLDPLQTVLLNGILEIINSVENVVMVSDYLFSDSIKYDCYTENFRKELSKSIRRNHKETG